MQTIFENAVPAMSAEENIQSIPDGAMLFGNLLKAGSFIFNPSDVTSIDFNPPDGCGCEVSFRDGEVHHLTDDEATTLSRVLASSVTRR